jgi:uncharacterized protein YbgA (DUF1722 family)/uncharacterized protein YbbK (DUF523 family)
MEKIRLGISACLLGQPVRYDGGHRHDRYLTDTLGRYFDYLPVCPEVECGLGTPRESMHLEGDPALPRLLTTRTGVDLTAKMLAWVDRRLEELQGEDLCGFIFKSNSPSSGMERVKVFDAGGMPHKVGRGLFAGAFMRAFPLVPVEDEGRLHDPGLRENFIERVFAARRWRDLLSGGMGLGRLVSFHSREKLLVMAHSPKHYTALGKLVAHGKDLPADELFGRYESLFMEALKLRATVSKNTNVLQHMMGYFKKVLSADEKEELVEVIGRYHGELVPLIVPVTLIGHYVRKYDERYLREQTYLNPHPAELRLRNHA